MAEEKTAVEERPELTVTVEDSGPARKELTIEIPEARIKEKIKSSFTDLRNDAQLPGFRKGRAPQRLLDKRFGKSVRDDARGQLISECYTQAIEEGKLEVLGEPDIKNVESIELPEEGSLTFKVEIEVSPEVKLPSLEGLEVTKLTKEVTDKDVNEEIERFGKQIGKYAAVPDAKVEEGDFIKAEVSIFAGENTADDSEPIEHYPETYIVVNGEGTEYKGHVAGIIVDDLGKRLLDKSIGETEKISMIGPPNHEDDKIKEQPITIILRINQVERMEAATIEQILENFGMDCEDDLRSRLHQMLEQRNEREQTADMHKQISELLLEKVALDLPEGLTGKQTARVLQRERMELAYRGVAPEVIEQQIAEMRAGSEEETHKQLKQYFIIDQAAKDLEVEVSESEVNGRITMMAMQQGRRPEKLRQEMHKRGELAQLYLQIREQKTLDQIIQKANVKEEAAQQVDTDSKKKTSRKSRRIEESSKD